MTSITIYTPIKPTRLYIKQHSITKVKYFGKTTSEDPIKYLGSGVYWTKHIKKHGKQFVETIWLSDLYYDTSIVEHALHFSQENNIVESKEWANLEPENGLNGGGGSHNNILSQKTSFLRYGYNNPFQVPSIKAKFKSEMLSLTGYDNPSKDPKIKQKKQETCFSNYGVEYPQQSITIQEQTRKTCLEKYGVEYVLRVPEIKQKSNTTNLEKYGHINPLGKGTIPYTKRNNTVLSVYGLSNVFQDESIIEKIKQTKNNKPPVICPHCDKSCKGGNVTRHHFDNCKLKLI
jgi:hypothetical protein